MGVGSKKSIIPLLKEEVQEGAAKAAEEVQGGTGGAEEMRALRLMGSFMEPEETKASSECECCPSMMFSASERIWTSRSISCGSW